MRWCLLRQNLAWRSIRAEREQHNLDGHQTAQVETKFTQSEDAVKAQIPEAYQWLLVPTQLSPHDPITMESRRLSSNERLAPRATKRMEQDSTIATVFGAANLRNNLDGIPLWRDGKVEVKTLFEDFAQFVYLQRLTAPSVLAKCISDGVSRITWEQDGFAFAETFDATKNRFGGLVSGQVVDVGAEARGWLVSPELAKRQFAAEVGTTPVAPTNSEPNPGTGTVKHPEGTSTSKPKPKTIFYGRVKPNVTKLGLSVSTIAQELVAHLQLVEDAEVEVTVEIRAKAPKGFDEKTIRTITENAKSLKFDVVELE